MKTREIKFRGKRLYSSEWIYGTPGYGRHGDNGKVYINRDGNLYSAVEVDPSTVGQFTGLKDKHGKDIYEGDVLRIDDEKPREGHVKWVQDTYDFGWIARFPLGPNTGWTPNLVNEQNRIEIIGNIHDLKDDE